MFALVGGLSTRAYLLGLQVAPKLHQQHQHIIRTVFISVTSSASRRCVSTTSRSLNLETRDIGSGAPNPVDIPVISLKAASQAKKVSVASSTEVVGVKITRVGPKKAKGSKAKGSKAKRKKPEAVGSKSVEGKRLKVTSSTSTTTDTTSKSKSKFRRKPLSPPKPKLALTNVKPISMSHNLQPSPSPYTSYVIVSALRKLPYKIKTLTRTDQLALAPFFDLEPFFTQTGRDRWEIYHDTDGNGKPVLLITLKQAWSFLDHVHRETGIEVPRHPKSNYCYRKRDLNPGETLKEPVKIATVATKAQWEEVMAKWANGTTGAGGEGGMTPEEKEARKQKQKEKLERSLKGFGIQVERARAMLRLSDAGERAKVEVTKETGIIMASADGGGGVRVTAQGIEKVETSSSAKPSKNKGKGEYEDIPFFVCVDCESWERNHSAITEIGISTLDMGAFPGSEPLTYETILPLMTYRHIRVNEYRSLRNGKFVPDAADLFDFGTTEFRPLRGLPQILGEAFTPPPLSPLTTPEGKKRRRTIVFVGHDAATDIKYLYACKFEVRDAVHETLKMLDQEAGFPAGEPRGMDMFDTAEMYRAITGELNPKGLGKMASELGLNPWNLHNAGNDAAFTLRAFVKMSDRPLGGVGAEEKEVGEVDGGVKI